MYQHTTAVQTQMAVSAYYTSRQILTFDFAEKTGYLVTHTMNYLHFLLHNLLHKNFNL